MIDQVLHAHENTVNPHLKVYVSQEKRPLKMGALKVICPPSKRLTWLSICLSI